MNARSSQYAHRLSGALIAGGLALSGGTAWSQAAVDCLAAATPIGSIDMRLLVVSADGTEAVFPAIKSTLDYLGVPYDTMIAKDTLLTADKLCSGADGTGRARYQGVLLATGSLGFLNPATGNYESAFAIEEWNRLWQYEAKYRIRQATLYTYPGGYPDNYGLTLRSAIDTTATPLPTTLTATSPAGSGNPSGKQVFSYLNLNNPIKIQNAWTYLATPMATVTPLLVTSNGDAIASINNYADGRKNLTVTTDGNPYLLHTLSLGYGIVNWVTKGLYVGQRRAYLNAQPDDTMIADDMWDPATSTDTSGKTYRITGNDYNKLWAWQHRLNSNTRNAAGIKLEQAFNGFGTSPVYPADELYPATTDDLTPAIYNEENWFYWVSHTHTHPNLDNVTYSLMLSELRQNDAVARNTIGMTYYHKDSLVTPQISGLNNAEAMRAMKDFGIRYIVSDTSKFCGHRDEARQQSVGCPKPNTGIYHDLQPLVLMIPRYPSNLFYNVCTPTEWTSEYNFIYRAFWGRDLSYQEILDKESEVWLRQLLNHDVRPVMFHQPNLCAYDGTRSLLGDLIDTTMTKYNAIYNVPVLSRRQRQIGNLMAERMTMNDALAAPAPLMARIVPGATSSSIVLTNPTAKAVPVPVTGVNWTGATSRETYAGQTTSKVTVGANGGTVTVPGAPAW